MLDNPDQDEDVLAFGDTERIRPRPIRRHVVAAAIVAVATVAGAAAFVAASHRSPSPRTAAPTPAKAAAPIKLQGIYLQEQGNGTILLPAALRHGFKSAGTTSAVTSSAGTVAGHPGCHGHGLPAGG